MVEPQDRYEDEQGGRFYEHPFRTNPKTGDRRFISVTTVTDSLGKDALKYWAAKGSSRDAMERLPELVQAARIDPCGNTGKKDGSPCKRCYECAIHYLSCWHIKQSERRKNEGSQTHDVIKWWTEQGEIKPHDSSIEPYVGAFLTWVQDFGVEPKDFEICETRVINPLEGYAGTLDGMVVVYRRTQRSADFIDRIKPGAASVRVGIDAKTREAEGKKLYIEMPIQLVAYLKAPLVWLPDNTEVGMPPADGGAILQLRPDGYHFEPVVVDDRTYQAFLHFLEGKRWQMLYGAASIRVDSFPLQRVTEASGNATETPAEVVGDAGTAAPSEAKKTARKTAAKKATKAAPAPAARTANATLDAIAQTGGKNRPKGATLSDDDIPF